jgi:uncharacterized protein (DUF433 family)
MNLEVTIDPEIMGGDPVFRGTRVPVHMIADILAQGETVEVILESYPHLTAEMVSQAPAYAEAHPLERGPRKQPWHDKPPIWTHRVKLSDIKVK